MRAGTVVTVKDQLSDNLRTRWIGIVTSSTPTFFASVGSSAWAGGEARVRVLLWTISSKPIYLSSEFEFLEQFVTPIGHIEDAIGMEAFLDWYDQTVEIASR